MKIFRGDQEIELTEEELYAAYCEQQLKNDEEDVREDYWEPCDEDTIEWYGLPVEELDRLLPEIATRFRGKICHDSLIARQMQELRAEAIHEVVQEHKGVVNE